MPETESPTAEGRLRALLDEAVTRDETVELAVEDLEVAVPVRTGADAPRGYWGFDGRVEVTVEGVRGPLAEWLALAGQDPSTDRPGRESPE